MSLSFISASFNPRSQLSQIPELPVNKYTEKATHRRRNRQSRRWNLSLKPVESLIGRLPEESLIPEQPAPPLIPRLKRRPGHLSDNVYFPYGRPGNGAPLLDPVDRYQGVKRQLNHTSIIGEEKSKRQKAIKGMLDAQIEEKRARNSEAARMRELEDKLEEERIARQQYELEEAYRKELQSREVIPDSPFRINHPIARSPKGPYFKPKNRLSQVPSMHTSDSFELDEVISKMKSLAMAQSRHTQKVLKDFESMRMELHRNDKSKSKSGVFRGDFQRLRHESHFLPLASTRKEMFSGSFSIMQSSNSLNRYETEASPAVRSQLMHLDQLMHTIGEDGDFDKSFYTLNTRFEVDESV